MRVLKGVRGEGMERIEYIGLGGDLKGWGEEGGKGSEGFVGWVG